MKKILLLLTIMLLSLSFYSCEVDPKVETVYQEVPVEVTEYIEVIKYVDKEVIKEVEVLVDKEVLVDSKVSVITFIRPIQWLSWQYDCDYDETRMFTLDINGTDLVVNNSGVNSVLYGEEELLNDYTFSPKLEYYLIVETNKDFKTQISLRDSEGTILVDPYITDTAYDDVTPVTLVDQKFSWVSIVNVPNL